MPITFKSSDSYILVSQVDADRSYSHYDSENYRRYTADTIVKSGGFTVHWIAIGT